MLKRTRQKHQTDIGELRTPVSFYEELSSGPEPTDNHELELLYHSFAEVYNPSNKDLEIMHTFDVKKGVTIKMRDPFLDYQVKNHHMVKIDHMAYADILWEVLEHRPDTQNDGYVVVLLKGGA